MSCRHKASLWGAGLERNPKNRNYLICFLPHVLFTLAIGRFQPFDPGVALLWGAGVSVGVELLRYLRKDVSVVRVAPQTLLHLKIQVLMFSIWLKSIWRYTNSKTKGLDELTERLFGCSTCGSPQTSSRMMVSLSDHGTFFRSSWTPTADSGDTNNNLGLLATHISTAASLRRECNSLNVPVRN